MELSFRQLRTKEVVNVVDGKRLGKVCDVVFCYPENRVIGIVAPDGGGGLFKRGEIFIEMGNVVKFGEDVVLVNVRCAPKQKGKRCGENGGEERCNAAPFPPPPSGHPHTGGQNRRSYEDYE